MDLIRLIIGLGLITFGADLLVRGSSTLALRAGLTPLFVGLTVVGFGTSAPELGASLTATLRGMDGVSVGNVVGSNIFNIGVILGLTALARPIRISLQAVRRDLLVALAVGAFPYVALLRSGVLGRSAGLAMLAVLALYLTASYRSARRAPVAQTELAGRQVEATVPAAGGRRWIPGALAGIVGGLAMLVLGSTWFVDGAVAIARALGVSELVIGLTIVSAGTSVPELATSVAAALRNSPDLAVGNVIGSNIFNVTAILGTCAVVGGQQVAPQVMILHLPVMLVFTAALVPLVRSGNVISRREGALLVAGYLVYLVTILT